MSESTQLPFNYRELQKDARYHQRRLQVIAAAGNRCQCCGTGEQLTVHHGYYKFKTAPWDYEPDTLWCLCWPCHEKRQQELVKLHKVVGSVHPNDYERLLPALRDGVFEARFGLTPAEAELILTEIREERQAEDYSEYSVLLSACSDNAPTRAGEITALAERIFPRIAIEVRVSDSEPDANASVSGPRTEICSVISDWFRNKQEQMT